MGIATKKINKRAAIYDPYLDTMGGGERYCLTVAEILLKNDYQVDIFWSGNPDLINKAQQRFSLKLEGINIVPDIFNIKPKEIELIENKFDILNLIKSNNHTIDFYTKINNLYKKFKIANSYDILFFISDGSIPFLFNKKSLLHIQVPFNINKTFFTSSMDFIKLRLLSKVICNSKFTAGFFLNKFSKKIKVLYPPVDVEKFYNNQEKENIILSVGRFDNILNAKKQDVLIKAFNILHKKSKIKNWKLVLAGGSISEPEKNLYLKYLKEISKGLPIEFVINPNFDVLKNIYSKSKIYWHAAGFGVDENIHPENTEHFGMTIVEAMASRLVPIVISKGGIPEIIDHQVNGYLWNNIKDLIGFTQFLINSPKILENISLNSLKSSEKFSKNIFEQQFLSIIK